MSSSDQGGFDWLFAPNADVADSLYEVGEIVYGDYDKIQAIRLFYSIEQRLAEIILYFDDVSGDERLIDSITTELVRDYAITPEILLTLSQNFLRACWGEIRLSLLELPPASPFLRALQNAIDHVDWHQLPEIRRLAAESMTTTREHTVDLLNAEEFPVPTWWTDLPYVVSRLPDSWEGFDIADVMFQEVAEDVDVRASSMIAHYVLVCADALC